MKKAAVIGARSMLGSELVTQLRRAGIETLSIGRSRDDDIFFNLEEPLDAAQYAEAEADIVFHCAASFADDSMTGLRQNFSTNATSSLDIVDLVIRLKANALIYAGSVFSTDPIKSYGLTKSIGEQVLNWGLKRQDRRFCSIRFSQIYDLEGRCCRHQPWFGRTIAYASRGLNLRMPRHFGVRNFLYVSEAAELMFRAAHSNVTGVHNAVHPESMTCQQIADVAYDVFGKGGRVVIAPEKSPFRRIEFPPSQRTFELLGKRPSISMRSGIGMIKAAGSAAAFGPMDVE